MDDAVHLRDYLYVLRKRRLALLFFIVLALAAGILFTAFEKVLYRAASTILIEPENPNVVNFKEVLALDASSTDYYQTQYKILESRSLVGELIEGEHLPEDPYLKELEKKGWRRLVGDPEAWPYFLRRFIAPPLPVDLFTSRMLRIKPVRNSRLVKVSVLHPDPARSAGLTNRLVELFIERNLRDRVLISKQATDLITRQLVELKEKVGQAERKLQGYKETHGLVNIPSIREKDKFLQDAKLELVKLQSEESKLAKRYLAAHPKMIHLVSQIEGLRANIAEEEKKALSLSRIAIDYAELERESESARQIYEALLSRLQETTSEAKTQASNILVVDRAQTPQHPDTPQPFLNLFVALFMGVAGSILLAFFLEYLDSTVKIPEDIERGLGLELLGIVPQADRQVRGSKPSEIFFDSHPHSPAAESVRALRTALLFRFRHLPGCRHILITSPNPEEGKSCLALNLAAAFQQNHFRVLLMDADLRKPKLHTILGVPSKMGLTDILDKAVSTEEAIQKNAGGLGFDFLASGSHSDHPTEILGSEPMKGLLSQVKASYDIVLMDSPPYLPVADVAVLSEFADGIVVLARYHRTDRRHLRDIRRRFNDPSTKVLGVVINQVSVREKDYYYHQYYYYGYGDHAESR